jgi:DNA modification methylase
LLQNRSMPSSKITVERSNEIGADVAACSDPEVSITRVAISELKLDPTNPRLHSDRQLKQLAKSIQAFGFVSPVLIDAQMRVIAGHGRIGAAKLLGRQFVPAISINHLSERQLKALVIADNRLAEQATWNRKLLREQLKALSVVELDFDIEAIGFEIGEIDLLIEGTEPVTKGARDPADALPDTPTAAQVSKPGDVWLLGHHRVLCGNSLDVSSISTLMQDCRANVVITDPPYNQAVGAIRRNEVTMAAGQMSESEFANCLAQTFALLASHSVNGSLHYIFTDWPHMGEILSAGKHAYTELKDVCVWAKDHGGMGSLYRSRHELAFVFKSGQDKLRDNVQPSQYGRCRTNVWSYPTVNSCSRTKEKGNLLELHPRAKPVSLVADIILDCSAQGDIVLDPFCGSGTTLMAAERTGRVCHSIELDPGNVDTILRRWRTFTGLVATHVVSGRSFADLEQEAANEQ